METLGGQSKGVGYTLKENGSKEVMSSDWMVGLLLINNFLRYSIRSGSRAVTIFSDFSG